MSCSNYVTASQLQQFHTGGIMYTNYMNSYNVGSYSYTSVSPHVSIKPDPGPIFYPKKKPKLWRDITDPWEPSQ